MRHPRLPIMRGEEGVSPYVCLGELISKPSPLDRGISAEASQSNAIPVRHQGRRDEDRAQATRAEGGGSRAAITTGPGNRPLAGLANLFVSSMTSAVMGGAGPDCQREGVRRARAQEESSRRRLKLLTTTSGEPAA
ncbi:hypothetical protein KVR01_005712 [Diaporthe batatas]|uniref:uncharacterized protein n=1 Tax=Diaporthe batatas TaxID=748121 RepID=UPI001D037C9D|nr:uncharacterized protein KVR01_005712 [Diaporthe batatas]KAG8165437.1 hypothetical protein KVR01_005712 [Diaporthe batatas]